jgi:AcrR family transcriptional regulator
VDAPKPDRRVRRTRELLRSALLSLIQEEGYDRITVQDILDRADVGRSTFYAHYRDKEDLLEGGFEDIRAVLDAERGASQEAPGRRTKLLQPLLAVFQHVDEHRRFWGPLARKGGSDVAIRILRDNVTELTREHLRSQFPTKDLDPTRLEAATHFVISACMGLIVWWLDNDIPYTAEEAHSAFQHLATQGVGRFVTTI